MSDAALAARAPEPWAEIDIWRSLWEALAIVRGDDPDAAVAGHKRLCRHLGLEAGDAR